jgi:hypothetical protein
MLRLPAYQQKTAASKPEAQAEGNHVVDREAAFPRLAPRASWSLVSLGAPSKITNWEKDHHFNFQSVFPLPAIFDYAPSRLPTENPCFEARSAS